MQKEQQRHIRHSLRLLFNEPSEVYRPTDDMLRVSGGKWATQNFIRCTQTTEQALNDSIELVGQTITQVNNPADAICKLMQLQL